MTFTIRIPKVFLFAIAIACTATGVHAQKDFEGLNFGVGLALVFPFDRNRGGVSEAEVDGNGIVRSTKESKRTPRLMLESHYFFRAKPDSAAWYCPQGNTCSHGPFVAIEAGSEGSRTIGAYGLGWMLGYKRNDIKADSAGWNLGLGYVVRTGVRVLGDGIEANRPLPTGDSLRYKEISQPGWMWLSSFSF